MNDQQLDRMASLFKALSDPARLRILGLLADRPLAGHEIASALCLTPATISHHMQKLTGAGLVSATSRAQSRIYELQVDTIRGLSRLASDTTSTPQSSPATDDLSRVFFDGPRLRQIPASRKKRVAVLRRLLERFVPGRDYPEAEVNALLLEAHDDVATLRRELVNYGFMTRDKGFYRVATELPGRGATVAQEVGDERHWFSDFVASATERAVLTGTTPPSETPASRP